MLRSNEYTGIAIEENKLKIARIYTEKGKVHLQKLDQIDLASELTRSGQKGTGGANDRSQQLSEEGADDIFGFEEDEDGMDEEEFGLDDMDEGGMEEDDLLSLDMVDEAEGGGQSNEVLLYNLFTEIDSSTVRLGLNVEVGDAIFQIIRDTNFNDVKKKDLIQDLEEKLESIYGMPKSPDRYAYQVRENGSLILASIDEEPKLLELVDDSQELYDGKVFIDEILPDEVSLVGLVNANYELPADQITGIVQLGPQKCRLIFMKGEEIWLVSPIINEGTKKKGFLNTIFSKILFQLDTGEVPNLDQLILTNNTVGTEATDFFERNFPDITVENFRYNSQKFSYGDQDPEVAHTFTTAIGTAWAAAGADKEAFPALSLIPSRVIERQKIFKLQWHGIILLLLIFLSPLTINYFYQQNVQQITMLESELTRLNSQIEQITPTVNAANQLRSDLASIREELVLLDTLSTGTREWSSKLNIINSGVQNAVQSSWVTGMQHNQDGVRIQGYSLYRNQIPNIVDLFADATLFNVNIGSVREQEVYEFTIQIKEFTKNKAQYSPPRPQEIQTILQN